MLILKGLPKVWAICILLRFMQNEVSLIKLSAYIVWIPIYNYLHQNLYRVSI
jgi:hypothetical protein